MKKYLLLLFILFCQNAVSFELNSMSDPMDIDQDISQDLVQDEIYLPNESWGQILSYSLSNYFENFKAQKNFSNLTLLSLDLRSFREVNKQLYEVVDLIVNEIIKNKFIDKLVAEINSDPECAVSKVALAHAILDQGKFIAWKKENLNTEINLLNEIKSEYDKFDRGFRGETYIASIKNYIRANEEIDYVKNGRNKTNLVMALEFIDLNLVEVLVNAGADVNLTTKGSNNYPINIAAEKGYTKIVTALLDAGAIVWGKNDRDLSPLISAARSGDPKIVKILIPLINDIKGETGLEALKSTNNLGVANLLINAGVKINQGKQILFTAIVNYNLPLIKLLIKNGAPINSKEILTFLGSVVFTVHNKEYDEMGREILYNDVSSEIKLVEEMLIYFINLGLDINKKSGRSLFKNAIRYSDQGIVKEMLDANFSVNEKYFRYAVSEYLKSQEWKHRQYIPKSKFKSARKIVKLLLIATQTDDDMF